MEIQEVARNTFTIAALLLTATIVILNYSWKRLRLLVNTMPIDKRRIRINSRTVTDRNERYKHEYIFIQLVACILFVVSLCGALIAVFVMSDVMIGNTTGIYAKDNFEFAVVSMRAGVFCLVIGMVAIGMVYLEDLYSLIKGEPAITTTDLIKLPELPQVGKAGANILTWSLFAYFVILGLIVGFVPYNQWIQGIIAIVAGIALIIVTYFVNRAIRTYKKPEELTPKIPR